MYGPVATWLFPYAEGVLRSSFCAYSFGTGADAGSASAPARIAPRGRASLKTIVWSSGVVMPLISSALPSWYAFRPMRSPM